MNKREINFEYLRMINTVAVIFIHTGSFFVASSFSYNLDRYGFLFTGNLFLSYLFDSLPRFAVPCFVMLSGAFILDNKRNTDFRYFYSKSFRNIGVATLVFSLLYLLYNLLKCAAKVLLRHEGPRILLTPFKGLFIGKPFYHMWFLYMLAILYLLTPFILIIENKLKSDGKSVPGWVYGAFLCMASLSYWTGTYWIGWDLGTAFCYLSYYLAGYKIRTYYKEKKNNTKGGLLILAGVLVLVFLAAMRWRLASAGAIIQNEGNVVVLDGSRELFAYEGLDPFVVIASVAIFAGFSLLQVKGGAGISRLSAMTFYVYLFHGGVLDIVKILLKAKPALILQNDLAIPFYVLVVLAVSFVLTIVYLKLWKYLDARWHITGHLCKIFRLEPPEAVQIQTQN